MTKATTLRGGCIAACWAFCLAFPAAASTLDRAADPLVLTGADLPTLVGIAPDELVAFRYDTVWQQIPVQLDERDVRDWGEIYNTTPFDDVTTVYTDAGTFAGPDSDTLIDDDDEIVVMLRDTGAAAPLFSEPPGIIADSGIELAIRDPLDDGLGYVYLFRQDGTLDPAAGQSYVTYRFRLLSGDYLTTYNLNAGPNPEDSTIDTPFYSDRFADRWIHDELRIAAGGATNVDILDRHKDQFAPGNCGRTEDTFSAGEGAFVVNKSGPVRALRSYLGANSGPFTQREHLFYERRQDIRTFLRVHSIGSVVDYFDYSPAANGMTYHNDLNTAGATIDGMPDDVSTGELAWEMVEGEQGSLIILHTSDTDIDPLSVTSYYLDDETPAVTQCTGDDEAWGASGPYITDQIPCTDPVLCGSEANRLNMTRTLYFDTPGTAIDRAIDLSAAIAVPLDVTPLLWIGSPGEVQLRLSKNELQPGSLELEWSDACSTTAEVSAVYEGQLGDFTSHETVDCAVSGTSLTFEPLSGDRYYLVVPVSQTLGFEGSYGRASDGNERPPAITGACGNHVPHACR